MLFGNVTLSLSLEIEDISHTLVVLILVNLVSVEALWLMQQMV